MSAESSAGATDTSEEAAPEQTGAVEQSNEKQTSFEDQLIQLAKDEGSIATAGAAEPRAAEEPETVQDEPEEVPGETTETPETPAEGEDVPEEEEQESATDKLVPLRDVVEERAKKRRANERADRAEAELQKAREELQEAQRLLNQSSGPLPTPDSPLIDVQDPIVLDRLERVYEALEETDIGNINEDGTVTVPSAIGRDGRLVYQNIAPEQAKLAQKRADRVLRKDIPKRREYLTQRAQIDADAQNWYPDLKQPDHQFTQVVNQLTNQVLSGQALQSPDIKFWVANAVYGYMKRREESAASNGNGAANPVQKIAQAARQKIAPTASRTRSIVERKSSVDLAKAKTEFEKNPSDENAALEYTMAILSGKGGQKTVRPVSE